MLSPAWQPAVVGLVVFSGRFDRLQPPAQVSLRVPGFCRSILSPGGLYCQVRARRPIRPYRRLRRRKCGLPLSQFHSDKLRTYQSALCLGQNAERDRNGYCAASLKPPKSLSPTPPRSPQTLPAIVPYWIGSFTYFPAAPACETISARFSPAKPQQAVASRLIRHERDAAELCSPEPFPASGSCISQNRNLPCSCGSSIYIPRPFCYNQKKHRTWR